MNTVWKNVLIGTFVLAALVASISFVIFLEPRVGDGQKKLHVRFSNISGISEGTRVTFAGKPVGEVQRIREVPNARQDITDTLKRVYFYQLTLTFDSTVQVYTTDEISVQTTGLLGEKTVAIIPKAPTKGVPLKPVTDQILYAISIDPVENALNQVSNVSKQIQRFVRNFDEWFSENEDELSEAVTAFSQSMNELDHVLSSINQEKLVHKITTSVDTLQENLQLAEEALTDFRDKNIVAKMSAVLEKASEMADAFNTDGKQILRGLNIAVQDVACGRGSLGKLITSDEFYLRLVSLLSKANTLMNDVNHYGVLFQYDKTWQRNRTKRANLLDQVCTPQEFRQYFSTEVDQINTALSRISSLMEKADCSEEKKRILSSHCFRQDFVQLLLDVEALFDNLKIYNEELIDYYDEDCLE
ncbi:MAG: MlaD family protein [Chlamydiota bacterium]